MTVGAPAARPEHHGQLQKLARRGTASVLGAGVSSVFGVVLVVIVTNGFTATLAGTLFAATSAFLILESVALLGTDTGLVRWLPAQLASQRTADLVRTLAVAAVPVLVFSLVVATALYAAAPGLAPYLVGAEAAPLMEGMLRALAFVLPLAALHHLVVAATRGMGTMRPTVFVENMGRLGLQALLVVAVYLAGGGAVALALAWGLPYLVGLAMSGFWLTVLVRRRTTSGTGGTEWGTLAREFWAYTGPRAIAQVTQTALKRSDIVLVAALASPRDAALYTAATRFIVLGQLFVQSVQQALSPHLSSLFAREETKAANAVFQAATRWSMIAAWPLYLVTAGFASTLLTIFGDGYSAATDVVVILSLTMLFATACGPVDAVLLMAGRSWLSLRNGVVALVVNIGLNIVLIPLDGIRGAAISWSVAIVVRNLLPLLQVRRLLGMWPATASTGRVALAALVCLGGAVLATAATSIPLVADVAVVATGAVAYLVVIWSWRRDLELSAFRATLRRRRSVNPSSPGA